MNSPYRKKIEELTATGSNRSFRPLSERKGIRVNFEGRRLINMTSNDYLGIAGSQELLEEFYSGLMREGGGDKYGLGAASSRLLTGDNPGSHQLEELLRKEYDKPACLLFNSGYHANIGILPTLTTKRDLILSDKLNHASIHDGMRLSRATIKRFRHCDYAHLRSLLEESREKYDRVIIVTESVFSMDGDEADLLELITLKKHYDCLLYVDEAHGVGVYGEKGLGKAEQHGVVEEIDLLVGTFGKAFAAVGAYVVCGQDIYEYLVNFSRSLIFTTALPPVVIHWNAYIFKKIKTMNEHRNKLALLSKKMRSSLIEHGLRTDGTTNIVPVIIGGNRKAVEAAGKMAECGFLIFAIRPPTVPEGTARFRLSLTANMEWQDIVEIPRLIAQSLT